MKKALLLLGLVLAFPALAAATWFFTTQVKSAGGNIVSPNMARPQLVSDGAFVKSYTTTDSLPATVSADPGYTISAVTVNGATVASSGTSYSTSVAGPSSQTLTASFRANLLSVTASAGYGGSVDKTSISNIYTNTKLYTALKFTFTPKPSTYQVSHITGVPAGATVSIASFPGTVGQAVSVTFPVNYVFTDNVALNATFSGPPIAIITAPQYVPPGTLVTLDGSPSTGTVVDSLVTAPIADYSWVQTAVLPELVTLSGTGSKRIFTPTLEGSYSFRLTVSGGSAATTNVSVTSAPAATARTLCQNCHQGNGVGVASNVFGNWSSSTHKIDYVMCPTCHVGADSGGHPGNVSLTTVSQGTFNYNFTSGNFCFSCHHKVGNLHFNSETLVNNICSTCHNSDAHNPAATMELGVGLNHFNGYTAASNPGYRAAYVTAGNQCANCHLTASGTPDAALDPALLQQRNDWARSGHGNTKGSGFLSQDFKTLSGCVQCHTAPGFIAYSSGKTTNAWGTAADPTRNVLSCNGCHSDLGTGALRSSKAVQPYPNDGYTNPDLGSSNLCLTCHSGTQSGRSIKALAAANADFSNLPYTGSHFSAAAGILFRSAGYQFAYKNYSNSAHFKHDRVGQQHFKAYGYDSGSSGPCVACHMGSPNKHSFLPLTKDDNGVITAVTGGSCAACHTGPAYLDAARMNAREAKFAAALVALQKVLESRGIYYADSAPYFFQSAGSTDPGNAVTAWGRADTMGAAFNFQLLRQERGAYAHNMIYSKRLIYDSIDYLDNGALDDSVPATIAGLAGLDAGQKSLAAGYLAPSGTRPK